MSKEANIQKFLDKFNLENIDEINEVLPERAKTIIEKRYGLTGDGSIWSYQDIGYSLNLSRTRVSQILNKAKYKLETYFKIKDGSMAAWIGGVTIDSTNVTSLKQINIGQTFRFIHPCAKDSGTIFGCLSVGREYASKKKMIYMNLKTRRIHNCVFDEKDPAGSSFRLRNIIEVLSRNFLEQELEQDLIDYFDTKISRQQKSKEGKTKNLMPLREWLKAPNSIEDREISLLFENKTNRHLLIKLSKAEITRVSDLLDKTVLDMTRKGVSRSEVSKLLKMIENP